MARSAALERLLWTSDARLRLGWRLLLFFALTLVLATLVGALLPEGIQAGSLALLVGSVGAGVALLALDGRRAGALGFPLGSTAAGECARGLGLGVAVAGSVVLLMAAAGGLRWVTQDGALAGWLLGGLGALTFLALPAAAEEALLRGYPLQALAEAWGPWWALGITSVAFGALHLANPGVTPIGTLNVAAAGAFLGIVYLKTVSLWWATGAHVGWNWTHGWLADVPVSGLELMDAPLYDGVVGGPAWIGGGSFGPEGSLVATGVVALACVFCWRTRWLVPSEEARAARPLPLGDVGPVGTEPARVAAS